MAANYPNNIRSARMTVVRDAAANGKLELLDASDNIISAHTLSATGGTVADGVWTLAFVNATVAATGTGVAAAARIRSSADADIVTGITVGNESSGADFKLQNTNIAAGQDITLTAATITDG